MSYSERFWNEFQKNIDNEIDKNANFMDIYKGRDKYTRKMNNKKYGIISKTTQLSHAKFPSNPCTYLL